MSRYLVTRLLLAIPTIIAVTVLIFLAMHVLPGDPLVALTSLQGFAKLDPDVGPGSWNNCTCPIRCGSNISPG